FNYHGTIFSGLSEGEITGGEYVGGICGVCSYGEMIYCENDAEVNGTVIDTGGICGQNFSSTIVKSYNVGSVSGAENTGGIAGSSDKGITSCYNIGAVSGDESTGGIVGENYQYGLTDDCYNAATISGSSYTGAVAGLNHGDVKNCYFMISDMLELPSTGGGEGDENNCVGLYAYQMTGTHESGRAEDCMESFDFIEIWATYEDDEDADPSVYYFPQLICMLNDPNSPTDYDIKYWPKTSEKGLSAEMVFITEGVSTVVKWLCAVTLIISH
ncbi:MAG: hypothetical protein WC900_10580, partial [Oscillospiraceae bacterium]